MKHAKTNRPKCQRCGRWPIHYTVTIRAVVEMVSDLCIQCRNVMHRKFPATTSVDITTDLPVSEPPRDTPSEIAGF